MSTQTQAASERDAFIQGVAFQDSVPVRWQSLDAMPEETELAQLNDHNEAMLRLIHALNASHPEPAADDAQGVAPEIATLEFKVDLLLDLVGELVASQLHLPARRPIRLTATGLEWTEESPPPAQSLVEIELFLSARCPRGFRVPARILHVVESESVHLIRARFAGLSEPVIEWLEKFIFQHHRRQVAQTRGR